MYPLNPKCPLLSGPQQETSRWAACWLHGLVLRWGGQEPPFPCMVQATLTEAHGNRILHARQISLLWYVCYGAVGLRG